MAELADGGRADFAPLYPDSLSLMDKIHVIARDIYGEAGELLGPRAVVDRLSEMESQGFGRLPVCMAKTPYCFSADPALRGAPSDHAFPVREVRLSAGAGFVVAICGDIVTMPGLPRHPSRRPHQGRPRRVDHGAVLSDPAPEPRPALRRRLLDARQAMEPAEHLRKSHALLDHLRGGVRLDGLVGFYWPFQAEWDPRPLILPHLIAGGRAAFALPVVVSKEPAAGVPA